MTTNWWISKKLHLLFLAITLFTIQAKSQSTMTETVYIRDTVYVDMDAPTTEHEARVKKYKSRWEKLIPSYRKAQFAGSMGLISLGAGWDYGKNSQWETDWMFGFVPKYSTRKNKITMTVKQNFIPWTVKLNDRFNLKPFSTGIYINTVFGGDFWSREPGKYPSGYYTFSTKIRLNLFVGQGWEFKFDPSKKMLCKSLTVFYEVSTNELYLISAFTNRYVKASDFLGLSIGLKAQIL